MVVFATSVTLGLVSFLGIAFARPFVRLLFAISLLVLSEDFGEVGFLLSCYFERTFIIFQFINRSDVRLRPDAVLVLDEFSHLIACYSTR